MAQESSFKAVFWHSSPSNRPGQLGIASKIELRFMDHTGCTAVLVQQIAGMSEKRRNLVETLAHDSQGFIGLLHRFRLYRTRRKLRRLYGLAIRRILNILLYSPKDSEQEVLILRDDWAPASAAERREVARKLREATRFYVYAS